MAPKDVSLEDVKENLMKHIRALAIYYGDRTALGLARKYVCWYCKNLRDARRFRERYVRIDNMPQALAEIENFFDQNNGTGRNE